MSGSLFTLSAPSGAGKTSLVQALVDKHPHIYISVSHTTRTMRPGEQDGINYNFVDTSEFLHMIEAGEFLEYAKVFGNYYGTSAGWVQATLEQDRDVILEIDWQGAAQVRRKLPETLGIFLLPPSRAVLRERLTRRGQDDIEVIETRLAEAKGEIAHCYEADYLIVNDCFEDALQQMEAIIVQRSVSSGEVSNRYQILIQELLA